MTDLFEPDERVADEFRSLMSDPAARQAFVELKAQHARSGAQRRYEHVAKAVFGTPWAIQPHMLQVIVDVVSLRLAGGRLSAEEIDERLQAARRAPGAAPRTGVAVIPVRGVIVPRATLFTEMSGGVSVESFRAMFREALAASDVGGIVLDIDSPGGSVDQVPEMAAEIRAARGKKPIVAVANTLAASAAYWFASQADEIVVSKSGMVGSIGVFGTHVDQSKADENEGLKVTLVSAGKFKTDGNPYEPLSDHARQRMQSMADEFYGMFVNDVARGRAVSVEAVRNGFGQGDVVLAREAVREGMADRVGTVEDAIASVLTPSTAAALDPGTEFSVEDVSTPSADEQPSDADGGGASDRELEDLQTELALLRSE